MTAAASQPPAEREISTGKLWWAIPLAMFFGTATNVVFYYFVTILLGEPLLFPEQFPPPETSPLHVTDVIIFSFIFSLGAGLVFTLMAAFSRRPVRTYLVISTITLLLSFVLPLSIPSPPVTMQAKLTLVAMHVIGAIVVVGTLIFLSRSKGHE